MYDHSRNGCQSQRWDYDSTLREYQSAMDAVSSELGAVNGRIKSVSPISYLSAEWADRF